MARAGSHSSAVLDSGRGANCTGARAGCGRLTARAPPPTVGGRLSEPFHLHELELAQPEDEVAPRYLVAQTLADLSDSERYAPARLIDYIGEVDEHPLRGLGPQPHLRSRLLHRTDEG